MASCDPFDVNVTGDLQAALDRVKKQITDGGGTFSGDTKAGTFSGSTLVGKVTGKYTVSGKVVTITITDKPLLAPCSTIESKIREYFSGP